MGITGPNYKSITNLRTKNDSRGPMNNVSLVDHVTISEQRDHYEQRVIGGPRDHQ